MTYIWQLHDNYPESMIGEYKRKNKPDRFMLKKGQKLGEEIGPWRFKFRGSMTRLRKFDDLANNAMVPLVSPRLADLVMNMAEKESELLASEIDARDGIIQEYRLLNVLTFLPAVDREHSEFNLIPGTDAIMSFRKLVLIEGCMQDYALARCAEYTSYLLVADELAIAIRNAGMTGLQLSAPSEIRA